MLEKLVDTLKQLARKPSTFDASVFKDDVALKTDWSPARSGGTNIGTHQLVEVSARRLEFRPRPIALLFPLIFVLVGLGVLAVAGVLGFEEDMSILFFGIPFGSIFFLVGLFVAWSWAKPRIFDLDKGYYWQGRQEPAQGSMQDTKDQCLLGNIHAIQILDEYCSSGNRSSYYSYELNLILKSAERIHVIDHGKLAMIREDAAALSRVLGVPVWDATETRASRD